MFEHRLHFKANEHDLGSCPRQTIQYNNNSSLCPYHQFRRSWSTDQLRSWSVLWRPRRPPRTHTKNRCSTHRWRLKCKSRKSRDTWSKRQVWPWSTKWKRAKANKFCQENILVTANSLFQHHKRWLYTWTSLKFILKLDWLYSLQLKMEKLYTVSKIKIRSWLWLRSLDPYFKIQA